MEEKMEGILIELIDKIVESPDQQKSLEVVLIILTQIKFGIPELKRKWKPLRV